MISNIVNKKFISIIKILLTLALFLFIWSLTSGWLYLSPLGIITSGAIFILNILVVIFYKFFRKHCLLSPLFITLIFYLVDVWYTFSVIDGLDNILYNVKKEGYLFITIYVISAVVIIYIIKKAGKKIEKFSI